MSDEPPPGYVLANETSIYRGRGFNAIIGPFYYRVAANSTALAIRVAPAHLNLNGSAHGGFLATLADLTHGGTVLPAAAHGLVTISLTIDYMDTAVAGDWLKCIGSLGRAGTGIAFATCEMKVGERPIAHAAGVFKLFSKRRI